MTAPTVVTRHQPGGRVLDDGMSTYLCFENAPALGLKEKEVTPGGTEQGDGIDTTTMWNQDWETFTPRQLKKGSDIKVTAALDPKYMDDLDNQVGVNQGITAQFPNGDYRTFWGYLMKWEWSAFKNADQPTVDLTIKVTNTDNSGNEAGPVDTTSGGT